MNMIPKHIENFLESVPLFKKEDSWGKTRALVGGSFVVVLFLVFLFVSKSYISFAVGVLAYAVWIIAWCSFKTHHQRQMIMHISLSFYWNLIFCGECFDRINASVWLRIFFAVLYGFVILISVLFLDRKMQKDNYQSKKKATISISLGIGVVTTAIGGRMFANFLKQSTTESFQNYLLFWLMGLSGLVLVPFGIYMLVALYYTQKYNWVKKEE